MSAENPKKQPSTAAKKPRASRESAAFSRTPISYDFKKPQRIDKDRTQTLESIHEQFAQAVSATLGGSLRMIIDVDPAFVDQTTFDEFILSLTSPCAAYSFAMEPPESKALFSFSAELLMSIIDRAFGGKGASFSTEPRPLTPIETRIVNQLVSRILQNLEATWNLFFPIKLKDIALETNPEFIRIADAGDPVVIIAFEANAPHASGLIHLCYPVATLEPLLPMLTPQYQRQRKSPRATVRPNSAHLLDKMQIPVVVQLARGNLPLVELTTLQRGDVIKLDTEKEEPAVVFVGKQPKFLAKPGLDGKHRAAKIFAIIDQEAEDSFR